MALIYPNTLTHRQPTVDNLRNFLLTQTAEMLSFFPQVVFGQGDTAPVTREVLRQRGESAFNTRWRLLIPAFREVIQRVRATASARTNESRCALRCGLSYESTSGTHPWAKCNHLPASSIPKRSMRYLPHEDAVCNVQFRPGNGSSIVLCGLHEPS